MLNFLAGLLFWLTFWLPSVVAQSGEARLQPLTHWGGITRTVWLRDTTLLIAEDDTLVQVPILGENAYHPSQRTPLVHGSILDLSQTPQKVYALTETHLLVLDSTLTIQQAIRGGGTALLITGNLVLVAARENGVRIYAMQSDGTLVLQSTYAANILGITVTPHRLLAVATVRQGVELVDLSNPTNPQLVSSLAGLGTAQGIDSFDIWVYAMTGQYVHLLNTADTVNPSVAGVYAPLQSVQDLIWSGSQILVADGKDGLKLYSAANVNEVPRYINGERDAPIRHIYWDGEHQVILATTATTLRFYDDQQLPQFRIIGEMPLWNTPQSLTILPTLNLAAVGLGTGGLGLIDYNDPVNPTLKAALPFSGGVNGVLPHPDNPSVLYLTLNDGRLITLQLNLDNPTQSRVLTDISLAGNPTQLAFNPTKDILGVVSDRAGTYFFRMDGIIPIQILNQPAKIEATAITATTNGNWLVVDGTHLKQLRLSGTQAVEVVSDIENQMGVPSAIWAGDQGILWGGERRLSTLSQNGNRLIENTTYIAPTHYYDSRSLVGQLILLSDAGLVLLDVNNPFQPRELQILPVSMSAQQLHLSGNDVFLTGEDGVVHWRVNLPEALFNFITPQVVGNYQPIQNVREFLSLSSAEWGLLGKRWERLSLQENLSKPSPYTAVAGIEVADGIILLDENFHPYRLSADGTRSAENLDLEGVALAGDGEVIWLLGNSGHLQALDPQTLDPLPRATEIGLPGSALAYWNGELFVGTRNGTIMRLQAPQSDDLLDDLLITQLPGLGGVVHEIKPILDSNLLVSAGQGGLWWFDVKHSAAFERIAHETMPAYSASLDTSQQWLAVGMGVCGLQIWDARQRDLGLRPFAEATRGIVEGVNFLPDGTLLVTQDGLPTHFQFNPDGQPTLPPLPNNPNPPDGIVITTPITRLAWQPANNSCGQISYEVWVDGQKYATTTENHWELPYPASRDFEWVVVAIDPRGERITSPTWQAFAPIEGWLGQPLDLSARLSQPEEEHGSRWQWWLLLGLAGMLLLLGLIMLTRRLGR